MIQTFHIKRFGGGDLRTSINGKDNPEENRESPINCAFNEASRQKIHIRVFNQFVINELARIFYLFIIHRVDTFFFGFIYEYPKGMGFCKYVFGLHWWLSAKESTYKARVAGLFPESGRSLGGGHGNPFQYSCRKNPIRRGALQATVHRVTKSQI